MVKSALSRFALVLCAMAMLALTSCGGAKTSAEESRGPDRDKIAADLDQYSDVVGGFDQVRAIVVATDDRVVFEHYYGTDPATYWDVASVTKSVVSTLIGIAIGEGRIQSVDQTLAHLLPQHAGQMSPAVAGTTLRQLLTMTGGFPGGLAEFTRARDWVREILTNPESPPGGSFTYSNASAHLVAAILQRATGMPALEYARSRLFGPLGITTRPAMHGVATYADLSQFRAADFAWVEDPQGVNTGYWGIKLRPTDMVKLGQLYLDGGRWHGRQVVPADWVKDATASHVDVEGTDDGYGYEWWTSEADGSPTFLAEGYGGQLIEVVPDRHLVVVTATEVQLDDPSSRGIDYNVLMSIIEDAIVSRVPKT